jgi:hypothetical protein
MVRFFGSAYKQDKQAGKEWTVFVCPQSVFKMHPTFDQAVGNILLQVPNGHLLFTEGRHQNWTYMFRERLFASIHRHTESKEQADNIVERIHFTPRVPGSDAFLQLVSVGTLNATWTSIF